MYTYNTLYLNIQNILLTVNLHVKAVGKFIYMSYHVPRSNKLKYINGYI